jgi:hypothetical protein
MKYKLLLLFLLSLAVIVCFFYFFQGVPSQFFSSLRNEALVSTATTLRSATGNTVSRENSLWVDTHPYAFKPLSGTEAYYPNNDINDDRLRDTYLSEMTNEENWKQLVKVQPSIVVGLHALIFSSNPFKSYSKVPITKAEESIIKKLIKIIKTSITVGGIRLSQGETLLSEVGCTGVPNDCLGEGIKTARVDFDRFLLRWITLGGVVDYITTDHPVSFAATAILDESLGIKRTYSSQAPITLDDINRALLEYYSESYDLIMSVYSKENRREVAPKIAITVGSDAFTTMTANGTFYPSKSPYGSLLKNTSFEDFLNSLEKELLTQADRAQTNKRGYFDKHSVTIIFDLGTQNVISDGSFEKWNFNRIRDNETRAQKHGFKTALILQPGVYAYSADYVYTLADVVCADTNKCVKTVSRTLSLANQMSYEFQSRMIREYLAAGGTTKQLVMMGWHRYPSSIGPIKNLYSWFGKTRSLAGLFYRKNRSLAARTTLGSNILNKTFSSLTSLKLHANTSIPLNSFIENRLTLLADLRNEYRSVRIADITPTQKFNLNFQLTPVTARTNISGWSAVQLAQSEGSKVWSNKGLSVMFQNNGVIKLIDARVTPVVTLESTEQLFTENETIDVDIEKTQDKLQIWINNRLVLKHALTQTDTVGGGISFDAYLQDVVIINPTISSI